jgi:4-amino-4-deoxy-L-arabinose transferase-like glycosyltransferase
MMLADAAKADLRCVQVALPRPGSAHAAARTLTDKRFAILLILLSLVPLATGAKFVSEPLDRDEGAYAVVASGMLDGLVPYRDLFDHKPPAIFGWYALSFLVVGEEDSSPRLAGVLAVMATTALVGVAGRQLLGPKGGLAAAGLFAASTALARMEPFTNTEPFMLLPMVASLSAALRARDQGSWAWAVLAGILGAFAVLTKPVAVANGASLAGLLFAANWRLAAAFAVAAVATCAAAFVPFAVLGALPDAVYANFAYNALYSGETGTTEKLRQAFDGWVTFALTAAPFVLLAARGAVGAASRRDRADVALLAWAAASALGASMTGRFFPHYFLQTLPACALLGAWALSGIGPLLPRRRPDAVLFCAAGVAAIFVAVQLNISAVYLKGDLESLEARDEAVIAERQLGVEAVGRYIADRSQPGDEIFNYGRESQVYFYAGRNPSTPYFYYRPFRLDESTLQETVSELRASPPAWIVDTSAGDEWDLYPPELFALLMERYVYEGRVEFADLYRLRR